MAMSLMCRVARGTGRVVVEEGLAGPGARLRGGSGRASLTKDLGNESRG